MQKNIKTLPRGDQQVVYYTGSPQDAIATCLSKKKLSHLVPNLDDPQMPCLVYRVDSSKKSISSELFMGALGRTFCDHSVTPMAQVETAIATSTILDQPPYLSSQCIKAPLEAIVTSYTSKSRHFAKTPNQQWFLGAYQRAVIDMLSIFKNAKKPDDLENNWEMNRELVESYDSPVDLTKNFWKYSKTRDGVV